MDELGWDGCNQKMSSSMERVTVETLIPAALDEVWRVAGSPLLLARFVPMLGSFQASSSIGPGARLSETHTILGWPQKYEGHITKYLPQVGWAMSSSPVSGGPASLPHDVEYAFASCSDGSTRLEIRCDYRRQGLLRWPLIGAIVRWWMTQTLRNLSAKIYALAVRNRAACS